MNCKICDTNTTRYDEIPVLWVANKLKDEIKRNNIQLLVITGGEPTLQFTQIKKLLNLIPQRGLQVQIETNGTLFEYLHCIDYVISPKKDQENIFQRWSSYDNVFFKFVISSQEDLDKILYLKEEYAYTRTIWLQPEYSKDLEMTNLIRKNFPRLKNIKLSPQTHKYLNQR